MDTLDRELLVGLARHQGWPSVTIYQPASRVGSETQQDPLRLKNLLKQAEDALLDAGMRTPEVNAFLREAWQVQSDTGFWRGGFEGLALFVSEGVFRVFRTSVTLPERVRVAEHFLIRPLVPALAPPLHFYVLALSKKQVRLLEGTAESVREVDPEHIPQGLAEALKYDDYETQVQFHSRTPAAAAGRGRRSAVFHGHGGHADTAKDDLERYFRLVDKGLKEHIGTSGAPLLLAGVDYLLPIYRMVNTYADLLPEGLTGNPDEVPAAQIHAEALELLEPYLKRELESDLAALDAKREAEGSSADVRDIVLAAHGGRVQTLFVADNGAVWGRIEPDKSQVLQRETREPGDADLLDRAAAQTLLHGGSVHVMAAEEAAAAVGGQIAALLRY